VHDFVIAQPRNGLSAQHRAVNWELQLKWIVQPRKPARQRTAPSRSPPTTIGSGKTIIHSVQALYGLGQTLHRCLLSANGRGRKHVSACFVGSV
jgi:hypothetical protein